MVTSGEVWVIISTVVIGVAAKRAESADVVDDVLVDVVDFFDTCSATRSFSDFLGETVSRDLKIFFDLLNGIIDANVWVFVFLKELGIIAHFPCEIAGWLLGIDPKRIEIFVIGVSAQSLYWRVIFVGFGNRNRPASRVSKINKLIVILPDPIAII